MKKILIVGSIIIIPIITFICSTLCCFLFFMLVINAAEKNKPTQKQVNEETTYFEKMCESAQTDESDALKNWVYTKGDNTGKNIVNDLMYCKTLTDVRKLEISENKNPKEKYLIVTIQNIDGREADYNVLTYKLDEGKWKFYRFFVADPFYSSAHKTQPVRSGMKMFLYPLA